MERNRFTGLGRVPAARFPLFGRGFGALMVVSLLAGCTPGDGGDQSPPEEAPPPSQQATADSAGLESTGSGGPARGGSIPGEPNPPSATQEPLDSIPPGSSQGTLAETGIEARLARLEAENDSLRVTVGALLSFLATGAESRTLQPPEAAAQASPPDSAGLTGEILAVNAQQVQHWGFRIAVATFFLLFTGLFIRLVIWVLEKLAERNPKRRLFFKRLVPIARIALWFLAILFTSMVILQIQAQGLLAAGAAVGVAVGFAAQDILKNIFGGLIVLFDQPFQVGDKISVAGTYGEVVSIGLRSTRIVTPDDSLVSVPNSQVVGGQVANANAGELNCQVVTDLFLPGWVDESKAKKIAFEAAAGSKYVYLNKPIVVLVKDEFQETFLTHLKVKAYVLDPRYEFLFMSDVTERARSGFRKAGLLGPMHGVRAYIDLDRFPEVAAASEGGEEHE
jgi:small-conductance mechanosensitive channel